MALIVLLNQLTEKDIKLDKQETQDIIRLATDLNMLNGPSGKGIYW